jgi:hypothetical protein
MIPAEADDVESSPTDREAQGLPPHVEDPEVLQRVAALLKRAGT